MGFRGSLVQTPPARLGQEKALQRFPLWGLFACPVMIALERGIVHLD
jgi:hypothetical protein